MPIIQARVHFLFWLTIVFLITTCNITCGAGFASSPIISSQTCAISQPDVAGKKKSFSGNVSWYGPGFQGRKTASGEIFDMNRLTAAHLTLPLGTKVLVEDPKTGKSVIVKVNDRGPYVRTRVMDLAKEGGRRLDLITRGTTYANCLIIN